MLKKTRLAKNKHENECSSCTLYIVLFSIIIAINVVIGIYFIYSCWYLKKDNSHTMPNTRIKTKLY